MDQFSNNSYSNNDGNTNFSTNWTENEGGGNGATGGNIFISAGRLTFNEINNSDDIFRSLNLSGITKDIVLTIDYDATNRGNERLRVELWNSSSNSWQTITTIQSSNSGQITYTLTNNQKSNQSGIRFSSRSNDWDSGEIIYIDNVTFRIEDQPPVVTATGDQLYCVGSSVPVVETISISDPDDAVIQEVSIQISAGYILGEDILTLTGSHPNIVSNFILSEGRLVLTGPATIAEFEAAVAAVEFSSNSSAPSGTRDFSIIVGDAYFLPETGHYYQFFSEIGITWTAARDKAALSTYYGLQGYLATLTSVEESNFAGSQISGAGWIGGSDEATEGVWKWVTGPEAGTTFWNGNASGSSPNYAFWNTGEPNQSGNEDYAHITEDGTGIDGSWNDLSNTGAGSGAYQPKGYVVEYGGISGDPIIDVSASTTISISEVPVITTQPDNQEIVNGGNATFSVAAIGTNLQYQWQVSTDNGITYTDILGATGTLITITNASFSDDGNLYVVNISESGSNCGAIISNTARLTILLDTDGDGYADVVDLDDDNDGILDSVENPECAVAGSLYYEFYDLTPTGNTVDNIPTSGALSTGLYSSFDVDALQNEIDPGDSDNFSIRYRGQIEIVNSGSYTFFTTSDDGSKLYIDGIEIVNNDGLHGTVEVASSPISLTSGTHDIEVLFFENSGGESLQVQYQGPSITKQQIPFSILSTATYPNLIYNGDFSSFYYDGWTRTGNQWQEPTNDSAVYEDYSAATSTFSQNISTEIGKSYVVQFDLGVNTGFINSSDFRLLVEGIELYTDTSNNIATTNGGSNIMASRSFSFTASNITTAIVFEGSATQNAHHKIYVDNISVKNSCSNLNGDVDNDGLLNSIDPDSDGDGCNDANEAYGMPNIDLDNNGMYGIGSPAVNSDGTVIAASYATPVDGNTNNIYDFLEVNSPALNSQPIDVSIITGNAINFAVITSEVDYYQWQVSTDDGVTYTDIFDGTNYSGTQTASLSILTSDLGKSGNRYRVLLQNVAYTCFNESSYGALLTISVGQVITNRRITYRVKTN